MCSSMLYTGAPLYYMITKGYINGYSKTGQFIGFTLIFPLYVCVNILSVRHFCVQIKSKSIVDKLHMNMYTGTHIHVHDYMYT